MVDQNKILSYLGPILGVLEKQTGQEDLADKMKSMGITTKTAEQEGSDIKVDDMVEVEDKYEIENIDAFIKKAEQNSFVLKSESRQEDCYMDAGQSLRKISQGLRIRKNFDQNGQFKSGELKWEGPKGEISDRPVIEVRISSEADCDDLKELMADELGIEEFSSFIKNRQQYNKETGQGDIGIELDSFPKELNPEKLKGRIFAQVSMEVEPAAWARAIEMVKKMVRDLELKNQDSRDYPEIAVE